MEAIIIDKDIPLMQLPASSFPDGIDAAHKKLHALVPSQTGRKYYGLSRPENGAIAYKAAAEEMYPGEAAALQLETILLKKGNYVSIRINHFMRQLPAIKTSFEKLLSTADLDPEGYCVEWYVNDTDMICMLRLKEGMVTF